MTTSTLLLSSLAAAALCSATALSSSQGPIHDKAPSERHVAEAGKLFAASCAACHLPPDPSFAVDRAWLAQVKDTA